MTAPEATGPAALLRERIAAAGPLSVADYMAAALDHPDFGYYATRDPLGRGGDFVTAPEISQIFGELLGAWCVAVWQAMGAPAPVRLVELGPGCGTLLADAWRAWRRTARDLTGAARLHLVETSPRLRARQQDELSRLEPAPVAAWHLRFAEIPPGPVILIANEFFDALPIRQYVCRGDRWRERLVGLAEDGAGFAFVDGNVVGTSVLHALAALPEPGDGAIFELCPAAEALAGEIGARLARDGGGALIVDYGHRHSAAGETLQAVRAHRFADPLVGPGDADLSHHVDFERLATAAVAAGARAIGPVPQGLFLGRLGIAARAEALAAAAASPAQAEAIAGAARRLVHPGRMGVLFKALALVHPDLPPPPGMEAGSSR